MGGTAFGVGLARETEALATIVVPKVPLAVPAVAGGEHWLLVAATLVGRLGGRPGGAEKDTAQ